MLVRKTQLMTTIMLLVNLFKQGSSGCYFSLDFQGEFLTQVESNFVDTDSVTISSSERTRVQYSKIVIQPDGIPIWGKCFQKIQNNAILVESGGITDCYRCFRLNLRSANVVELLTHSLDKCFAYHHLALQACPQKNEVKSNGVIQMLLFRNSSSESSTNNGISTDVNCPINGHFNLKYSKFSDNLVCHRKTILLSNCPSGNQLEMKFSGCGDDKRLKCIADWNAAATDDDDNQSGRFVALVDELAPEHLPKFKCGLLTEEMGGLMLTLSLSRDSSCSTFGHEIFEMSRLPGPRVPSVVKKSNCVFPSHLQDSWEDLEVKGGSLFYKDKFTFEMSSSDCIQKSFKHPNRFLVHTRTQCGEGYFNCVWFESRTPNVMEFQFGTKPSTIPTFDLCDNNKFLQKTWITQARRNLYERSSCPIAGDYTGILPDGPQFCAKMSSDCNNLDTMFFSVSECRNVSEVLEDREYQCLGQWEENGSLFTYTRRRDIEAHECFVGGTDGKDGGLYLIESGLNCRRGLAVTQFGMQLAKQSNCQGVSQLGANGKPWFVPTTKASKPIFIINAEDFSTKAWQPMIGEKRNRSNTISNQVDTFLFVLFISVVNVLLS